jgi:hypothetical protein
MQSAVEPICFNCAKKEDDGKMDIDPPTPEQIRELKQELERRKLI